MENYNKIFILTYELWWYEFYPSKQTVLLDFFIYRISKVDISQFLQWESHYGTDYIEIILIMDLGLILFIKQIAINVFHVGCIVYTKHCSVYNDIWGKW